MTLVPKVYAPTPAQNAAVTRAVPSARIASVNGSIDETAAGARAAFDAAPFSLQEEQQRQAAFHENRSQNLPRHAGRIIVPSQDFSALVEYQGGDGGNTKGPEARNRLVGAAISKAIATYETNAKIIHGEPDVTGTEISLRL